MHSKKTKLIISVLSVTVTITAMTVFFISEFRKSIIKYTIGYPK